MCAKTDLEEYLFTFLKNVLNEQNIYMISVSNETWISENGIVEELPLPDMTYRGDPLHVSF